MLFMILVLSACSTYQPWKGNDNRLKNYTHESYADLYDDDPFEKIADRQSFANHFEIVVWNVIDTLDPVYAKISDLKVLVMELNNAFASADIQFELKEVRNLHDYHTYESLVENRFANYYDHLIQYNTEHAIDLYLVDHDKELCYNDGKVRGCAKGRGFTATGDWLTSIVLGKEDVKNKKIPIHEFGHFFNLEHTHYHYDKQNSVADCSKTGDLICDTPPDPGAAAYGAMVNYTDCEMYGAFDEDGVEFKPMINNYMSYYPPCYMVEYAFTEGQIKRMKNFVTGNKRMPLIKSSL